MSRQTVDPGSTLWLYRNALRLRRALLEDAPATIEWRPTGRDDVLAFRRGRLTVVCLFGTEPYSVPEEWGELALASSEASGRTVHGPGAAWLAQ